MSIKFERETEIVALFSEIHEKRKTTAWEAKISHNSARDKANRSIYGLAKKGNIIEDTNVCQFSHARNTYCRRKSCFMVASKCF